MKRLIPSHKIRTATLAAIFAWTTFFVSGAAAARMIRILKSAGDTFESIGEARRRHQYLCTAGRSETCSLSRC